MDKYILVDWVKAFFNTVAWLLAIIAGFLVFLFAITFGVDFVTDFVSNNGEEIARWVGIIALIGLVGFMFKTELDEARRKRIKKGVRPEEIS